MPINTILAITTYNRKDRLQYLLDSFIATYDQLYNWRIIIADDGSTDDTIDYVDSLKLEAIPITLIKNNRNGVHHQFNTIINELSKLDFDFCFKCDDDINFIKSGWEKLYIDAINKTEYDHLCHFDQSWRPEKILKPIKENSLVSYCKAKDVQGAFFTLTPRVIEKVGYMDTEKFGFRGVGHIDYSLRACRAGFNNINHPFDVQNSNHYIIHQKNNYVSALNVHVQNAIENDKDSKLKYQLIEDDTRIYIPFIDQSQQLTPELEKELLIKRIEILEQEKKWYEKTYGHQPRWFFRAGKLLKLISFWK